MHTALTGERNYCESFLGHQDCPGFSTWHSSGSHLERRKPWEGFLCTQGCLAASPASVHYMLVTPSQSWRPKLSPHTTTRPFAAKSLPVANHCFWHNQDKNGKETIICKHSYTSFQPLWSPSPVLLTDCTGPWVALWWRAPAISAPTGKSTGFSANQPQSRNWKQKADKLQLWPGRFQSHFQIAFKALWQNVKQMPGSPKSYKQGNVKNNFIMSKFFKFKLKPQTLMKITFQSLKYTSAMSSYFFTHKIVTIKPGESMLKLTAIKLEFFLQQRTLWTVLR